MSRIKVLNTYWGASREEVKASEEGQAGRCKVWKTNSHCHIREQS